MGLESHSTPLLHQTNRFYRKQLRKIKRKNADVLHHFLNLKKV